MTSIYLQSSAITLVDDFLLFSRNIFDLNLYEERFDMLDFLFKYVRNYSVVEARFFNNVCLYLLHIQSYQPWRRFYTPAIRNHPSPLLTKTTFSKYPLLQLQGEFMIYSCLVAQKNKSHHSFGSLASCRRYVFASCSSCFYF